MTLVCCLQSCVSSSAVLAAALGCLGCLTVFDVPYHAKHGLRFQDPAYLLEGLVGGKPFRVGKFAKLFQRVQGQNGSSQLPVKGLGGDACIPPLVVDRHLCRMAVQDRDIPKVLCD